MATPAAAIAEAVKDVAVEAAHNIAQGILKEGSKDLKSLENSVAKEAVSDDVNCSFLEKVEGAAQIVANEVVKGAQNVVTAVEEHPELLAEGALAIAVGAVSLIQPEFLAGEVAIIGKMAGDSAKATLTKIAQDEGTKVVQAISKDASEDAKKVEEAHQKAEEAEKIVEAVKTTVSTQEKVVVDPTHDGLSAAGASALGSAIAANVSPEATEDQVVTLELDQPDAQDETVHHPITLKITVGADGQVKGVAQTVVDEEVPEIEEVKKEGASETKIEEPKKDGTPQVKIEESKPTDIQAEETKTVDEPKAVEYSEPEKTESSPIQAKEDITEAPIAVESKIEESPEVEEAKFEIKTASGEEQPISLNVTIAADGHVENVTQTILEPTSGPVEAGKSEEVKSDELKAEGSKKEVSESVLVAPMQPVKEESKLTDAPIEKADPAVENKPLKQPKSEVESLPAQAAPIHPIEKSVEQGPVSSSAQIDSPPQHILEVPTTVPELDTMKEESPSTIKVPLESAAKAVEKSQTQDEAHSEPKVETPSSAEHVVSIMKEESLPAVEDQKISESEPVKESISTENTEVDAKKDTPAPIEAEIVVSEAKSLPSLEEKTSEPEPSKAEEPIPVESNPSKIKEEVSAPSEVKISAIEQETVPSLEEKISEPVKEDIETKPAPEALIEEQKPVIGEAPIHSEPEKEVTILMVGEATKEEESSIKAEISEAKEDENPIHVEKSEAKTVEIPVEKHDELKTLSEETAAKEISIPEPQGSMTEVDEPIIQKSDKSTMISEPVAILNENEVVPEIKEEADEKPEALISKDEPAHLVKTTKDHVEELETKEPIVSTTSEGGEVQEPSVEKPEALISSDEPVIEHTKNDVEESVLVSESESKEAIESKTCESEDVKDAPIEEPHVLELEEELTPVIEPTKDQVENPSLLSEVKKQEPIESTAPSHKEVKTSSKDIIEGAAPVAILAAAAAALVHHETSSEDLTNAIEIPAVENSVKKEEELTAKDVPEEAKIDSTPLEPEISHEKENIATPKAEELTLQANETTEPEVQHEGAIVPSSVPEIASEMKQEEESIKAKVAHIVSEPLAHIETSHKQESVPEVAITAPTPIEPIVVPEVHAQPPVVKENEPVHKSVQVEPVKENPVPEQSEQAKQDLSTPVEKITKTEAIHESVVPEKLQALKETSSEALVQPKKAETSAPAVQEPMDIEHSKEPVSEPIVPKSTEESKEKEVQLPLTVEHVSRQTVETPEPKAKDLEIEAKPSSSEITATEIAIPVLAAAASIGVAKAISPSSETAPRPSSPTYEDLANIHTKLDNINETLQQLTKTLSQTSAQHVPEPVSNPVEQAVTKEAESILKAEEPITTKSIESPSKVPEPTVAKKIEADPKISEPISTVSEPITTKAPDAKAHEHQDVKVRIKSIEHVKSAPSTSTSSTSAPIPSSSPDADKTQLEPSQPTDTSSKSIDRETVSATPLSTIDPAVKTKAHKHAKRSSIWSYLWPFGGGGSSAKPIADVSATGGKVENGKGKEDVETGKKGDEQGRDVVHAAVSAA